MSTSWDYRPGYVPGPYGYSSGQLQIALESSEHLTKKHFTRVLCRMFKLKAHQSLDYPKVWSSENANAALAEITFLFPDRMEQFRYDVRESCMHDEELRLIYRQFCEEYSRAKVLRGLVYG